MKLRMMTNKQLEKLEQERWDISYRRRKPKVVEPQVNKNKAAEQEDTASA